MSGNMFPDAGIHFTHPWNPCRVLRDVAERGHLLPRACSEINEKAAHGKIVEYIPVSISISH